MTTNVEGSSTETYISKESEILEEPKAEESVSEETVSNNEYTDF